MWLVLKDSILFDRVNKLIWIVSVAAWLTACASDPSTNTSPTDITSNPLNPQETRLLFKRTDSLLYFLTGARVRVNGNVVTKLSKGGSFYLDTNPGQATVSVNGFMDPGMFSISLVTAPGGVYEFQVEPRTASFLPSAVFGLLGSALDAQINSQSGYFQIQLVNVTEPSASQSVNGSESKKSSDAKEAELLNGNEMVSRLGKTCEELGFVKGTEKYGECVLKLMEVNQR